MSNWLTGIIVLLIIIILVDGYRRRNRNRIDVSPALKKRMRSPSRDADIEDEVPPSYISELPNGGARVVSHREKNAQMQREKPLSARELKEQRRQDAAAKRTPEQAHLNLDEEVPILMESVEQQTDHLEGGRIEPHFSSANSEVSDHEHDAYIHEDEVDEDDAYDDEEYDESAELEDEYTDEDEADDDYADDEPAVVAPEEVLVINIMAAAGTLFNGSDLLDIVLKCGLRYGHMDIFHRYSGTQGDGEALFSMTNMVAPGTFDLDAMDEFSTPGVSLFMMLPIKADSIKTFDLMADTAQAIAQTLHGELKDQQRSAMTRQTLEHYRQRIREYERKKLFSRPS